MKKKQSRILNRDGTSVKLLKIAGEGALLTAAILLSGPGLGIAVQKMLFGKKRPPTVAEQKRQYRAKIMRSISRLEEKRLVRLVETPEGTELRITEKGKKALSRTKLEDDVRIHKQPWDRKWRIVLFDVPEEKRIARDALREVLDHAGFFQLQKSVFVGPFPCEKQVMAIADYFEIAECVTCAEASMLGRQEAGVRKHFGLL